MPIELVDGINVAGDGLVGHDQDAVGAVDGPDQVQLRPSVRAGAVEDGDTERGPPLVKLSNPLVEEGGGGQDNARAQPPPRHRVPRPRDPGVGERGQKCDHLDGLTQAHLVTEDSANLNI